VIVSRIIVVGLLSAIGFIPLPAQEDTHETREDIAHPTVRMPLKPGAVLDNIESRAHAALDRIHHPQNSNEVEAVRSGLLRSLKHSIGYDLLPWPPDLRATIRGRVQRDRYRIENLAFQTLPGVIMTAHLYVPEGRVSPMPAVLLWNGHLSREGKLQSDSQMFSITMAHLGFVVLNVDSMGAGERVGDRGIHHPEALLVGLSEAGIDEYEARCALRYLESRTEVDAKRIGMTGVNDGGFNTWITTALEEHIVASVPVDSTFDFGDQIDRMRAVDWEGAERQSVLVPGILRYANIQELLAITAPRPVMIIDGATSHGIYDYGTQVYGSFGANGSIRFFESDDSGYSKPRRQAAYGFFLLALKREADGTPADEPPAVVSPSDSPDLMCLPKGTQISSGPGISQVVRQLSAEPSSSTTKEILDALIGGAPPGTHFTSGVNPVPVTRINLRVETGVLMPATVLRPGEDHGGGSKGALLAIDDQDKESLASDPVVQEALRRDYMVWEIDPRGFGELTVQKPAWQFAVSLLLGENLVWRQAWDIRTLAESFCNESNSKQSIALYARGPNASLAGALAVKLLSSSCMDWAVLRGGYTSIQQFLNYPAAIESAPGAQTIPYDYFAFDALRAPDLPELLESASARTFLIDPLSARPARVVESNRVRVVSVEEFIASSW
jgi:dienelactone hydrolase